MSLQQLLWNHVTNNIYTRILSLIAIKVQQQSCRVYTQIRIGKRVVWLVVSQGPLPQWQSQTHGGSHTNRQPTYTCSLIVTNKDSWSTVTYNMLPSQSRESHIEDSYCPDGNMRSCESRGVTLDRYVDVCEPSC